jgi:hypothetical protein
MSGRASSRGSSGKREKELDERVFQQSLRKHKEVFNPAITVDDVAKASPLPRPLAHLFGVES